MEKFTTFEDKSNGINPYVPIKRRPRGWAPAVLGFIVAPFKLMAVGILLLALALVQGIQMALPVAPVRWIIRLLLARPLARAILFFLGALSISESVPDARRLRFGRLSKKGQSSSARARESFGATVQAGDVIFSNYMSILEVLYTFARFGADFAVVSVPDGGAVTRTSVIGALWRAAWRDADPSTAPCNVNPQNATTLSSAARDAKTSSWSPIVCFPEGVPTNGKGVLQFAPLIFEDSALSGASSRVHLLGIEYTYDFFAPTNPATGVLSYLYWSCAQFKLQMNAQLVPVELRTAEREARAATLESESKAEENSHQVWVQSVRDMLAMIVGNRGVKTVELGMEQYFAFMQYYTTNNR